jgi:ABC-type glycerol-3-phosphate transport system substrate-binding protein
MAFVRRSIFLLLVISAAWLLWRERPRQEASTQRDFVTVQYWEKWTGDEAASMRQIVDDFNRSIGQAKHVRVEFLSMSNVDQKTLVATAAGVPPDIAGVWEAQLVQLAAMDALEPLDDLAAAHAIDENYYKRVYWDALHYDGRLWGLVSTPFAVVLHYNKALFQDRASELRAAGLDPDRPPRTIDELDRYAAALTTFETIGGRKRIKSSGHMPLEPGWYTTQLQNWFGGDVFDPRTGSLTITSAPVLRTYDWIAGYSRRYGKDSITEFRSGLGSFASAQNPFLTGTLATEYQGPWMVNFIEMLAPQMNRWGVPADKLAREKNFTGLRDRMTRREVDQLLGKADADDGRSATWDAGIKLIRISFWPDGRLLSKRMDLRPALERRKFCQWGAAPFPSAMPTKDTIAFCGFDVMVIPRGSKHKQEAGEFVAYVNRQDVMEKLCALHCKLSPLRHVSRSFVDFHPNPYIEVFEDAANSPGAFCVPQIPIWPEINDELTVASQKVYLLEQTPAEALRVAQERCQAKWDYYRSVEGKRQRGAAGS